MNYATSPRVALVAAKDLTLGKARFPRVAMEVDMPRASWRGFLRLSLVSCPIYLSPATSRAKPIRLHQVWRPAPAEEADGAPPLVKGQELPDRSVPRFSEDDSYEEADQTRAATRITLRPHDPSTGEEVEKEEVVKGYEYRRGQFVTFTAEEMGTLDVESSKVIDLEKFVPRGEIDPVYFDSPYYLYPDGPIAAETLRVIGAAMAEAGVVGLRRLTLSRRERMVMVEPRGTGMALFTLRAANEVRASQFDSAEGDLDAEMVAIAGAIIKQRTGTFDPGTYRDRYQEALRELIEAKMKGVAIKPRAVSAPPPVIDLMAALKRSLAKETPAKVGRAGKGQRTKATPDRRQASLLLPVSGGRKIKEQPAEELSTTGTRRRRKA
jgi:DNA end-binding protein Ku